MPTTRRMRGRRPLRAACAYAHQEGQSRRFHRLPSGLDLEVIAQHPPAQVPIPGGSERPPLVFVHGSFHAAWCWAEHWLPFFSRAGFPCFALSLRAQATGGWHSGEGVSPPELARMVVSSGLQLLILRGTSPYWRTRMWNGVTVSGMYQSNISSVWYQTVVDNGGTLDYTGMVKFLICNNSSLSWTVFVEFPSPDCRRYDSCGLFGYCDVPGAIPACKCLEGFEPGGHNFSRGCLTKQALKCGEGDHFLTVPGMTVPDKFLYVRNRSFDECAAECNHNCSCTAYAYTNWSSVSTIGDPSRCLVWMGELVDPGKASNIGENLYLRLAGSPGHNSEIDKKKRVLVKIVLPVVACLLILACLYLLVSQDMQVERCATK